MNRPVVVDTPYPTLEELADMLGVSHTHAKRMEKYALSILRGNGSTVKRRSRKIQRATRHGSKKAAKK